MSYVTRCPFCKAIWRLPDLETARRAPVKCSACNHSFDAMDALLNVPDDALLSEPTQAPASAVVSQEMPEMARQTMSSLVESLNDFDGTITPSPDGQEKIEPVFHCNQTISAKQSVSEAEPAQQGALIEPALPVVIPQKESIDSKPSAGFPVLKWLLSLLLCTALALIGGLIFHQQVLKDYPQLLPTYKQVCSRITCPGFFLRDVSAFTVSRTELQPEKQPDHYLVESVIVNTSSFSQAFPNISLELFSQDGTLLVQKNYTPNDFLKDTFDTALGAGKQLKISFFIETNSVPSKAVVKPF